MGRRGPKPKTGDREANGRLSRKSALQRIADADRRERDAIMAVALSQPHRRGDADPRLATALGRFCKSHGLAQEVHDAGQEYASCVQRYLSGLSAPKRPGAHAFGSGAGPTEAQMKAWLAKITAVEKMLLRDYGADMARKVRLLCYEDREVPDVAPAVMVSMLYDVAVVLGFVSANPHPFAALDRAG